MDPISAKVRALQVAVFILVNVSPIYAADAVFESIAVPFTNVQASAMAWGDYDNDGHLDVIITGWIPWTNEITTLYRNNGNGTFSPMPFSFVGYRSSSVEWGDYDNDGYLDLLISGLGTGDSRVYHNERGTNFVESLRFGINYDGKVSWGDFNNDGKLDFASGGAGSFNELYQNLGGTNFALLDTGMPQVYYGSVGWADYNWDGNLDLLLTGTPRSGGTGTFVYSNDGAGHFDLAWSGIEFEPGRWLDIDNDGWPDFAVGIWNFQITDLQTHGIQEITK